MNNAGKRRAKKAADKQKRNLTAQNPNKIREDTAYLPPMLRPGWKLRNKKAPVTN